MASNEKPHDSDKISSGNRGLVADAVTSFNRDIYSYSNGSVGAQLAAFHAEYLQQGRFVEAYYRNDAYGQHSEFVNFINELNQQCESLLPGEERRVQLLCRVGTIHFSVIDFKLTQNNIECAVIDSAAHARTLEIVTAELPKLSHCQNVFVVTGDTFEMNVQKSGNMCMYFGFEQIRTLQEVDPYPDLHEALQEQSPPADQKLHYVSWNAMHPRFVKDAESRGLLEEYYEKNIIRAESLYVKDNKMLKEYVRSSADANEPRSEDYPNFPQKGRAIINSALKTYISGREFLMNNLNYPGIENELAPQQVWSNEAVRNYKANMTVPEPGAFAAPSEDTSEGLRKKFVPDDPYQEVPPELQLIRLDSSDPDTTSTESIFDKSKEEYRRQLEKHQDSDDDPEPDSTEKVELRR